MANVLGTLFVNLQANTADFVAGMSKSSIAARRAGKDIEDSFSKLGGVASKVLAPLGEVGEKIAGTLDKVGSSARSGIKELGALGGIMGGVAAAGVGIGAALFAASVKAAEFGSKIWEMHEKTGLSSSSLSGLAALAKLTGEDFDSLSTSLGRAGINLEKTIEHGGKLNPLLFQLMGGAKGAAELGLKPLDDRLQIVLKSIFAMSDTFQRNLALTQLLGKGWQSNFEVLKLLAEQGYGPAIEKAKQLGINFDDEHARQAKEYSIQLNAVKAQASGLAISLGSSVIPQMMAFTSTLANAGLAVRGLWADLKLLTSIEGGWGGMKKGWEEDKAAWDAYRKGLADFKKMTTDLTEGAKHQAEEQGRLALETGKTAKAHHGAADAAGRHSAALRGLAESAHAVIPHLDTLDTELRRLYESDYSEKLRGAAEVLHDIQTGKPAELELTMPAGPGPGILAPVGKEVSDLRLQMDDFFAHIQEQGKDLGAKVFGSLSRAIDDISGQLASLVVTGRSDFKRLFVGLEEEILKAGFQDVFARIAGSIQARTAPGGAGTPGGAPGGLGGVFGGILGKITGVKPGGQRGESPGSPLYVQDVSSKGGIFGGGGVGAGGGEEENGGGENGDGGGGGGLRGIFSGITSKLSSVFSSLANTLSTLMSKLASGMSSIFSGIGGLFGGGRQHGGDVVPGKAYIVGERHPEFFVPKQPGQVRTALDLGGRHQTVLNFHVNGVQDADSFRRSRGQIMGMLQNQMAAAYARNRG